VAYDPHPGNQMNRSVPNLTWIVAWVLTLGILLYFYVGL
jgi:hypothetical protein